MPVLREAPVDRRAGPRRSRARPAVRTRTAPSRGCWRNWTAPSPRPAGGSRNLSRARRAWRRAAASGPGAGHRPGHGRVPGRPGGRAGRDRQPPGRRPGRRRPLRPRRRHPQGRAPHDRRAAASGGRPVHGGDGGLHVRSRHDGDARPARAEGAGPARSPSPRSCGSSSWGIHMPAPPRDRTMAGNAWKRNRCPETEAPAPWTFPVPPRHPRRLTADRSAHGRARRCFMTGGTCMPTNATVGTRTSGCFPTGPRTPLGIRNCLCGRSPLHSEPTANTNARNALGCDPDILRRRAHRKGDLRAALAGQFPNRFRGRGRTFRRSRVPHEDGTRTEAGPWG